jgi:hypothetical protein
MAKVIANHTQIQRVDKLIEKYKSHNTSMNVSKLKKSI